MPTRDGDVGYHVQAQLTQSLGPAAQQFELDGSGGAELAAEMGADSADHLGRISEAGIALVVVATPVAGKRDRDPALRRLVDECLSAQARATGFSFLPRKLWGDYPRDHFYDPVHMSSTGRMRFSRDLGRALAERVPAAQTTD